MNESYSTCFDWCELDIEVSLNDESCWWCIGESKLTNLIDVFFENDDLHYINGVSVSHIDEFKMTMLFGDELVMWKNSVTYLWYPNNGELVCQSCVLIVWIFDIHAFICRVNGENGEWINSVTNLWYPIKASRLVNCVLVWLVNYLHNAFMFISKSRDGHGLVLEENWTELNQTVFKI
jgi:hypothetical protein